MSILNSGLQNIAVSTPRSDQSQPAANSQQRLDNNFSNILKQAQQSKPAPQSESLIDSTEEEEQSTRSVLDEFMAWMQMSPAEKLRDRILKEMGLTEEQLNDMEPEEQEKIEALIAQKIRDELELQNNSSELG